MSPIRILVLCFAVEVIQFFCATEKKSAINKIKNYNNLPRISIHSKLQYIIHGKLPLLQKILQ